MPLDLSRFKSAGPSPSTGAAAPAAPGDPFSVVAKERRVQDILASVEVLPSLPSIVMEVMQLANDEQTKAADFESVITKDQSLAAKVLKMVNSPFFALRNKVNSIPQAIVILGIKSLKSVVLAAKANKLLDRQLKQYGLDAGGAWKHAVGCATGARFIAKKAGLSADDQEELFAAGLLHDIGKIIIGPHITKFQNHFDASLAENGHDLVRTEEDLVGISHAGVGGRMARKWCLDPTLEALIRDHHHSLDTIGAGRAPLHCVQLADQFCNIRGIGLIKGPREATPSYEKLLDVLGLSDTREDFENELAELLEEIQKVFEGLANDR